MRLLEVLIGNLELSRGHGVRLLEEAFETSLPRGESIESGQAIQCLVGQEEQRTEQYPYDGYPRHDLSQLLQGYTAHIHHQEHHTEEQQGGREVLRHDEGTHDTRHPEDPLHRIGRRPLLRLCTREDECRTHDHTHLG